MKKRLIILSLLALFLSSCANPLFYHPNNKIYKTRSLKKYNYEEVKFKSLDNTILSGLFIKSVGKAHGTIIHFHGNAGNLTGHLSFVDWIPEYNFNLFTFDYRGYGKSRGKPNRDGIYKDCLAAMDYIFSRDDIDKDNIFILGQSLGGANAISINNSEYAKRIKAICVDSAFYSYRQITRDKLKLIPLISFINKPLSYLIVSNEKSPEFAIDKLKVPLLVIHGKLDRTVPFKHGQMIFNNANTKKEFIIIENGKHTDAFVSHRDIYKNKMIEFFLKNRS